MRTNKEVQKLGEEIRDLYKSTFAGSDLEVYDITRISNEFEMHESVKTKDDTDVNVTITVMPEKTLALVRCDDKEVLHFKFFKSATAQEVIDFLNDGFAHCGGFA